MEIEAAIRESKWWDLATRTLDRHFTPSAGVYLADHLFAVWENVRRVLSPNTKGEYFRCLHVAVQRAGMDLNDVGEILRPVALLHDIGKPLDDRMADFRHPLTGELVKKRHAFVSLQAALELLPPEIEHRATMLALIEEHDRPFYWFRRYHRSGQMPESEEWARLDRKVEPAGDGTGLVLMCLFRLADVHGHFDLSDVPWFIAHANHAYLDAAAKHLPVPETNMVRSIRDSTMDPMLLDEGGAVQTSGPGGYPRTMGEISAVIGHDVRELLMDGYDFDDVSGILAGEYTVQELLQKGSVDAEDPMGLKPTGGSGC